jgi:hypothetical protein
MEQGRKILRGKIEAGTQVQRQWSTEGYVEVPKEMLRQAGFDHGQHARLVSVSDNAARLESSDDEGDSAVHTARMCLRLWRGTVRRAGLNDRGDGVTFHFDGTRIEVRT